MAYYHTCETCGANLDPGEQCDCTEGENTMEDKVFDEKVNKYGAAIFKVFMKELKGSDLNDEFTAMLCAVHSVYVSATDDEIDMIDFAHILNRMAIQYLMVPKTDVEERVKFVGTSDN